MKITIICPIYHPDITVLNNLKNRLNKQNFDGLSIQKIFIDGTGGLARTYNSGISKSKGEIIITLHQDCVPKEKKFIKKLIEPFKEKKVVMVTAKIRDFETKKDYFSFPPDGKATAYRKKILKKVGFFDDKTFFTGGEDVDIYLKMKKFGRIINVNTVVEHVHGGYLGNKTFEKRKQNGNINGCLFKKWGVKNPFWWKAIIMCFLYPFSYGKQFLHAFKIGKQDYMRKNE